MSPSLPASSGRRLRPLRALLPYLRPYRLRTAAALLALVLAAVTLLAMPRAVGQLIDAGFVHADQAARERHFLLLFVLAVLAAVFASLRFYLVSWLGERVVADLRGAVFRHVLGLGPTFFEVTRSGELLSRLTTDTTLIQSVVGSSLSIALRSSLTLFGGLVMLAVTSPRLTLLILLVVPLVILPIVVFGRRVRRLSRASQDRIADTSALAGEVLNAIPVVQAFNLENLHAARFEAATAAAFVAARRRIGNRALLIAYAVVAIFGALIGVIYLGAQDVASGRMSSGELGQFLLYAIFVGGSTAGLSEIWGALQQAAGAAERLGELLATEPEQSVPARPLPLPAPARGALAFEHVGFHYPSRPGAPALVDFSLAVASGETVALVGPSGAGKSTVFALALAFYRPQRGRVMLDGVDLALTSPQEVRRRIAVVPQDTVLFADSILENIRYGRPEATDREVHAAARGAAAAEFIERLPQGYATPLGERGLRLSGGQQQRIALARAVLKAPALLLLDEATSALDADSEALVEQALGALMRNRTTLIIAHRLATVQRADRIVVLDGGRIVASGTHAELTAHGGLYARLAARQFQPLAARSA